MEKSLKKEKLGVPGEQVDVCLKEWGERERKGRDYLTGSMEEGNLDAQSLGSEIPEFISKDLKREA